MLIRNDMLKDVVNIIKDTALRHKAIRTFRYTGDDLQNKQHNYKTYQCYLDDVSFHQLNITTNIFKAEFNLYILGFPEHDTPEDILDVQNSAYTIAADIVAYIDQNDAFRGSLSVYDYSILVLSHYTGQSNAGVKLSLILSIPSPVNLCELDDNFNDEPYEEPEDKEIDVNEKEIGDIDIKTIKLPKNKC